MVCKNCGKKNEPGSLNCSFCHCPMVNPMDNRSAKDLERYETDIGFSNPDADYLKPQVLPQGRYEQVDRDELNNDRFSPEYGHSNVKKQKKRRLPFRLIFGGSVMVIIAVTFLIYRNFMDEDSAYHLLTEAAIEVYSDDNTGNTYVYNASGELLSTLDTVGYYIYNPEHSAAFLAGNGGSYYVNATQTIRLDTDFSANVISDNGRYILYSTQTQDKTGQLYFHDVKTDMDELIEEKEDAAYGLPIILPDGKTFFYTRIIMDSEIEIETFRVRLGQEPVSLGKDMVILAVSNHGEYIYYCDYHGNSINSLYVRHKEENYLLSDTSTIPNLYLNQDRTEIMFVEDSNTYVSVRGGERKKVFDSPVNKLILPKRCITSDRMTPVFRMYGISTFQNKVILCEDGTLLRIGNQFETEVIATDVKMSDRDSIILSEDGNSLIYLNTASTLVRVSDIFGEYQIDPLVSKTGIVAVSGDLLQIYYKDFDRLFYINENNEVNEITTGISELCFDTFSDAAFFIKDYQNGRGTLYCSRKGGPAQPVPGGEEVSSLLEWNQGIIIQKEEDRSNNAYYITKGKDFKLLQEGVDMIRLLKMLNENYFY